MKKIPIVVTTVLEKNNDCPKLQFGSLDTFFAADTPLLLARTTSSINASRSSSKTFNMIKAVNIKIFNVNLR